jgi:hypothetical protein|mmetsp:Transcript_4224/g.7509  ORF Transcript_4224/g.7509 Transcript_4224/m.7509 type:complete len:140 (-) Transcript_4224:29-448(-)
MQSGYNSDRWLTPFIDHFLPAVISGWGAAAVHSKWVAVHQKGNIQPESGTVSYQYCCHDSNRGLTVTGEGTMGEGAFHHPGYVTWPGVHQVGNLMEELAAAPSVGTESRPALCTAHATAVASPLPHVDRDVRDGHMLRL